MKHCGKLALRGKSWAQFSGILLGLESGSCIDLNPRKDIFVYSAASKLWMHDINVIVSQEGIWDLQQLLPCFVYNVGFCSNASINPNPNLSD